MSDRPAGSCAFVYRYKILEAIEILNWPLRVRRCRRHSKSLAATGCYWKLDNKNRTSLTFRTAQSLFLSEPNRLARLLWNVQNPRFQTQKIRWVWGYAGQIRHLQFFAVRFIIAVKTIINLNELQALRNIENDPNAGQSCSNSAANLLLSHLMIKLGTQLTVWTQNFL